MTSASKAASGFTPGAVPCRASSASARSATAPRSATTTITGKVYDPAGANALYNVMVYIPGGPNGDAELPPITEGVSCQTCASVVLSPMVSTLTNDEGRVRAEGRARRQGRSGRHPGRQVAPQAEVRRHEERARRTRFRIASSAFRRTAPKATCRTSRSPPAAAMRSSASSAASASTTRSSSPARAPRVTSTCSTAPAATFPGAPEAGGSTADPLGGELWNDIGEDVEVTTWSCSPASAARPTTNKGGDVGAAGTRNARQAMWDYANAGGKIFATHYHYTWFKNSPQQDWQQVANWKAQGGGSGAYDVDQTFPKGASFADWLVNVNASSSKGTIQLTDVTDSLSNVNAPAQSWIAKGDERGPLLLVQRTDGGGARGSVRSRGLLGPPPHGHQRRRRVRSRTAARRRADSPRSRRRSSSCSSTSRAACSRTTPRPPRRTKSDLV